MITRNVKSITATVLQRTGTGSLGLLPMRGIDGIVYYAHGDWSLHGFPYSVSQSHTLNAADAGISFGTGATPATEDDFQLENTITSGINVSRTSVVSGCDAPDDPYLQYAFTITNTRSSALTIREVGYKQKVNCATTPIRNDSNDIVCLLDRTVLDTPLELAAGDAGVLVYKLKTKPMPTTIIGGVEIASFEWGSDAQLAAMIDAAQAGTIDLQRDAGWRVGMMRRIRVSAFTGGNNVSHSSQYIDIVISSFEDYNNCGCVLQFDFVEALAAGQRMNASNTNVGGYGATEMKTVTLPALANALPTWLKDRLITFDVLASAGNRSSAIETVSGNKLALRSEIELFGTTSYSFAGEGEQVEYYKLVGKAKRRGYSGTTNIYWTRSPASTSSASFCYSGSSASTRDATYEQGVAPFGCV